jgi:hypothetical protein
MNSYGLGRLPASLVVLAVALVALLVAVPGARAATYCVGSPAECSGIAKPGTPAGLQDALSEAGASADQDIIRIGSGTYTAPGPTGFAVDSPTHGLHIIGEGRGATLLQGSGPNAVTLRLTGMGGDASTVSDLGVKLSSGGGSPTGLVVTDGGAGDVAVSVPSGLTDGRGVQLVNASFEQGSVTAPGLHGIETVGSSFVGSSTISAGVAIKSSGASLSVGKSRIETTRVGIATGTATDTEI